MVSIISGTNRVPSNTRKITEELKKLYVSFGKEAVILDLSQLPLGALLDTKSYSLGDDRPIEIQNAFQDMEKSELVHLVFPEYQGSLPGVLKFFIDHLGESLPLRLPPFSLLSLGGRFGGVQALNHLLCILVKLGVFVHRNTLSLHFSGEQLTAGVVPDRENQKRIKNHITYALEWNTKLRGSVTHS